MRFGPNSCQITIRRRPQQTGVPGVPLGDFVDAFQTWCSWRQMTGAKIDVAMQAEDAVPIVARVNDAPRNRTITTQDRVVLRGGEFAIMSVGLPDRQAGAIDLQLKRVDGGS